MATNKKGPIFRVTGLPAEQFDEELNTMLRATIDDNLSDEERSRSDFVTTIVPSCDSDLERVALVEFRGRVPDFLSDLVKNPLGDWQVEMGDVDISFDKHFFGFTQLYAPKSDAPITADIIAITGLDGHAYGSWRGKGNLGRMWLRDFLSKDLPCCRTMTYGYNSKLSSHGINTIMDYGLELIEQLKKVRNSDESRQRPLFFIAHSFGGIILAHCLVRAVQTNEDDHPTIAALHKATYGMLLFGIPHKGLMVDDMQKMLVKEENQSRSALLQQIMEKSDLLAFQLADFKNLIRDRKIISFYETGQTRQLEFNDETKRWERTGGFATAVDTDSALLKLPDSIEEKIPIDSDHSMMVKFDSRNNQGYTSARDKLRQFERDAATVVKARFLRGKSRPEPSILIPFQRDLAFVGRKDIIKKISEFTKTVVNAHSRIALVGLGGVGKSQIAIEYAYRIKESEPHTWVFWVHAANSGRFEQAYRDIADKAEIPGREDPKIDILKIVYNWLCDERNGHWLMILDNADDDGLFFDQTRPLESFLAQTPNGRILITSRNRTAATHLVGPNDFILQVEPMNEEDALALLNTRVLVSGNNKADAKELVQTLECIPLAITHAAAYIKASAFMTMSDYLGLFSESEANLVHILGKEILKDLRRDNSIRHAVITTWQISFAQIQKIDQTAADLLAFMSMFDRQAIPVSLLQGSASQLEIEDALKPLLDFSLVKKEVEKRSVGMHRLVQLSMWKWLEADKQSSQKSKESTDPPGAAFHGGDYATWAQTALKKMSTEYPFGQFETREICIEYLPHAYAVLRNKSTGSKSELVRRARLLHRVASYLEFEGRWTEAEQYQVEAVKMATKGLGPEHRNTVASMSRLSSIYANQGRWKEAEELGMKVMQISKRVLGEEDSDTLSWMADLGTVYMDQGRWKEAEELGSQVLEARKKLLGEDDKSTLMSMHNVASAYSGLGRLEEAAELGSQVLEARKKVLGDEHPHTLTSMANLAATYSSQKRWKEAEVLEVRVMQALQKTLGEDYPDTLRAAANLASTYLDQKRWEEGERLVVKVLETRKRIIGEEHPSTLLSMSSLAATYMHQARWKEAEELQVKVVRIMTRTMREGHPNVLYGIDSLVIFYTKQEKWKEAEEYQVRVLEVRKRVLGADHQDTLTSMCNLAIIWNKYGKVGDAIALMRECIDLGQRVLGTDHPETLSFVARLTKWENTSDSL